MNGDDWEWWDLNTPTEQRFRHPNSGDTDLDRVNVLLQWNPYPPDREERRQLRWERDSEGPAPPKMSELEKLRARSTARNGSPTIMKARELERLEEEDYKRESRSVTPEIVPYFWEMMDELSKARGHARHAIGYLAVLPGGKELLEADPNYWLDREEFRKEDHKLGGEASNDRSMTPEIRPPHHLGTAEGEAARNCARKVLGDLARLPAVRALLEGEEHGEDRTDPEYWSSREKIDRAAMAVIPPKTALERARRHAYTYRKKLAAFPEGRALLRNDDHGESASDPEYWRRKEKYYYSEYEKLVKSFWDRLRPARFNREETTLREAINGAIGAAIRLSSYREGRAILEAEDLRKNEDFKHWESRRDYYRRETINIEGESKDWGIGPRVIYHDDKAIRFWDRLETTFSRIKPPDRQFEDLSHLLTTPPRSPTPSTSKKRARRSSTATGHRPVTTNARGTTNVVGCAKESTDTGSAVGNIMNAGDGVDGRSSRSTGRRESKNAYRCRTKGAKIRPSHEHTLAQGPPNGLSTPDSGKSSNGRGAGEDDRDCYPRAKARTEPRLNTPNAYLTPESPQSSKAGVHKRPRRTKSSTRSKRRSNKDGAYRGPRSVSQAVDRVSSRLRSSGIRFDEEAL